MPLYNPTSAGAVADGTITSAKIADGTITTTDISTSSFDARYALVDNMFAPSDHGLISWDYDPAVAASTSTLVTAGTIYVIKLRNVVASTVTNIVLQITTAGSGLTAGQCFAGIYQAGALLRSTADLAASFAGTGNKTFALTSSVAVPAGDIYVALLFNGTTGPTLLRSNNNSLINFGLGATVSRWGTANTGATTLPGTLGTVAASATSYWVGIS